MIKPIYKILHEKAMDFVDEAKFAKMRGDKLGEINFLEKALYLEKEAAQLAPISDSQNFAKPLYYRSAANMAYSIGWYAEALRLSHVGLKYSTPDFLKNQLNELIGKIRKEYSDFAIVGILTTADAKENVITVEDETTKQVYLFFMADEAIKDAVSKHWADRVSIEAKIDQQGQMRIEKISAAA